MLDTERHQPTPRDAIEGWPATRAYRAARPQSSSNAKVNVTTQLAKDTVKLGEGVKLRARVENKTAEG